MFLKHLSLQNFRNYKKSEFTFTKDTTFIVGANTAGKTNLLEAIFLLSTGKSFKAEKDFEMILFEESISRVKGKTEGVELEVLISYKDLNERLDQFKKLFVNGVSKRRVDFSSNLIVSFFSPEDLEIVIGSPSLRRRFLDNVLEQVDLDYRVSLITFSKALRQRNALLEKVRETGVRSDRQFEYWDNILIKNGQTITKKREEFIDFINQSEKDIFDFKVTYDRSEISVERLLKYKDAEVGAGVTLVGPHRDDLKFSIFPASPAGGNFQFSNSNENKKLVDIKAFGSRGQQRLVVLQLKLLELEYIEKKLGFRPVFALDDIFSELDSGHIKHILNMLGRQQTIITTTHREFIPEKLLKEAQVIELTK